MNTPNGRFELKFAPPCLSENDLILRVMIEYDGQRIVDEFVNVDRESDVLRLYDAALAKSVDRASIEQVVTDEILRVRASRDSMSPALTETGFQGRFLSSAELNVLNVPR